MQVLVSGIADGTVWPFFWLGTGVASLPCLLFSLGRRILVGMCTYDPTEIPAEENLPMQLTVYSSHGLTGNH